MEKLTTEPVKEKEVSVRCDHKCFECIFEDCVNDVITASEKAEGCAEKPHDALLAGAQIQAVHFAGRRIKNRYGRHLPYRSVFCLIHAEAFLQQLQCRLRRS